MDYENIINILKEKTQPALGCTEPVALAYAGAIVREQCEEKINKIEITVDKNFYKNCLRVTIPNTDLKGLDYSVALGIVGGKAEYELEVLKDIDEKDVKLADKLINSSEIKINIKKEFGLYIDLYIETDIENAHCRIEGNHNNVTLIEKNGKIIKKNNFEKTAQKNNSTNTINLKEILEFINNVPAEEIEFLEKGRTMNLEIAMAGLYSNNKNFLGQALYKSYNDSEKDICKYAKILTTAACDARMNGMKYSVMSVASSGNQGIMSIVPIAAVSELKKIDQDKTLRAIALSELITILVKSKIGVLTPVCGCTVAAGTGAAAGITYLLGGDDTQICKAINNVIGCIAGLICDGAKGGCALKLAASTSTAFDSAYLALQNVVIQGKDGIVSSDAEKTIDNLAYITNEGMKNMDESIIRVMEEQ